MKLQGLHHITMITGEAQRNVDFYAGVLGLRMVKKTVNFDSAGRVPPVLRRRDRRAWLDPHVVRVPGASRGRAGAGMIHTIQLAVADRVGAGLLGGAPPGQGLLVGARHGRSAARGPGAALQDYDGLQLELLALGADHQPPLRAGTRRSPPSTRSADRGGTCLQLRPGRRAGAADRDARLREARRRRLHSARRGATRPLGL